MNELIYGLGFLIILFLFLRGLVWAFRDRTKPVQIKREPTEFEITTWGGDRYKVKGGND